MPWLGGESLRRSETHPAWLDLLVGKSDKGEIIFYWPLVLAGAVRGAALLVWFRNLPYARSPEESLQETIQQHANHAADGVDNANCRMRRGVAPATTGYALLRRTRPAQL